MKMRRVMHPAYAPSNALGICTYVRTDVLTNVLTYVEDESCVSNAHETGAKFLRIPSRQTASRYAHCRPDRRERHRNTLSGTRVGAERQNRNERRIDVGTETR